MSEQKWQLVPAEPNEEMLKPLDRFMRPEAAREILKEVLAAAPQPPAHELLASLECFESDGEDFVKLHDVHDVVAMIKQPPALGGDAVVIGNLHRDCDERIVFESSGELHIKDGMPVYGADSVARLQAEVERMKAGIEGYESGEHAAQVAETLGRQLEQVQAEVERLTKLAHKQAEAMRLIVVKRKTTVAEIRSMAKRAFNESRAALAEGAKS